MEKGLKGFLLIMFLRPLIKKITESLNHQEVSGLLCGFLAIFGWLVFQNFGRAGMIAMAATALVPLWFLVRFPVLGAAAYAFAIMFNLIFYFPQAPTLILAGTTAAIIVNKILQGDTSWRYTPFAIWSGLLFVWFAVTITWRSAYDYMGFGLNPDVILMALVFSEVICSEKQLKLVMIAAVLGCITTSCIVIYELISVVKSGFLAQGAWAAGTVAGTRYYGNWKASNAMSYSMMVGIAMSLFLFYKNGKILIRTISVLGLLLCLASIFLSLTRGALLWSFLLLFIYAVASEHRRTIFSILGIAIAIIFLSIPVTIFSRFTTHKSSMGDSSLIERKTLASAGLDMMTEWFPIGAGAGTFYQTSSDRMQYRSYAIGSHNSYVDVAAEMGIPGIILFLGMVASLWRAVSMKVQPGLPSSFLKNYGNAARAGLIGLLLALLTENLIGFWPFWLFLTLVGLRVSLIYATGLELPGDIRSDSHAAVSTA